MAHLPDVAWWLPVILRLVAAYLIAQPLMKVLTGMPSRTRTLLYQYAGCATCALLLAYYQRTSITADPFLLLIFLIGIGNGFAVYWQWRALHLSMYKTSLFTVWDDILAMSLSLIVLGEAKFLNAGIWAGITVSFLALALFVRHDYQRKQSGQTEKGETPTAFYNYVLRYSLIWGIMLFASRYFAVQDMPMGAFLTALYGGALLAVGFIHWKNLDKEPADIRRQRPTTRAVVLVGICSVFVMASQGLAYWAYALAPQNVVQPIFFVGEMILPALVGLYFFHERKDMTWQEWCYFALGGSAVVLIGLNFTP